MGSKRVPNFQKNPNIVFLQNHPLCSTLACQSLSGCASLLLLLVSTFSFSIQAGKHTTFVQASHRLLDSLPVCRFYRFFTVCSIHFQFVSWTFLTLMILLSRFVRLYQIYSWPSHHMENCDCQILGFPQHFQTPNSYC